MQLIFLLLCLFAIGCVLYGIAAGVQTIQRGITRLADGVRSDEAPPPLPACAPGTSPLRCSVDELRELFALYQQGALTKEEFESMKQCLLACAKAGSSQSPSPWRKS